MAQGSCLRPLLFNIFCNDIYLNIVHCNLILFADDTTLYASHKNPTYLNYMLQSDLNNLDIWFKSNMLSLNISKTNVMNINLKNTTTTNTIKLGETTLPTVDTTKFLGVHIDNKLTWSKHINTTISKISANKNLLTKAKHLLTPEAKKAYILCTHPFAFNLCEHCLEWPYDKQIIEDSRKNIKNIALDLSITNSKKKTVTQTHNLNRLK